MTAFWLLSYNKRSLLGVLEEFLLRYLEKFLVVALCFLSRYLQAFLGP